MREGFDCPTVSSYGSRSGDDMADADLYDVNGKIHHLSDFKGKYILIDFWSQGCAPCLQSLPELKEITEHYKERLTVVSLSEDTEKTERLFLCQAAEWQ